MSYIALYRKYRPVNYNEVVGQEGIIKILKNQVSTDKVSHAYIFSGTRGTGKTTVAKIFARAVNCLNPNDGSPCGKCEACESILNGSATDVVEMDAASNNSVENIRSIRQEVMYATTGLKYKVYIIDEAHMLSPSAFNALLKTLEEPPKGVIFILATTEEHKILPTILSRCIRFKFKKLTEQEIVSKLEEVLRDINIKFDGDVLEYIARLSDGALRDALSILERCIQEGKDEITIEYVKNLIGDTDEDIIDGIIKSIIRYNVESVEKESSKAIKSGKDLRYINSKLIEKFMSILISCASKSYDRLDDDIKEACKDISIERFNYIIKELSALDDSLRQGINNQIIFKAKLYLLASDVKITEQLDIDEKIKALQMKIEKLESELSKEGNTSNVFEKKRNDENKNIKIEKKENKDIIKEQKDNKKPEEKAKNKSNKLKDVMDLAVKKDRLKLYSAISNATLFEGEDEVRFVFKNDFAYSVAKNPNEISNLEEIVNEIFEKNIKTVLEFQNEEKEDTKSDFEKLMMESGINYEKID